MKKHLLKSLLALALVLISGNAWGASGTLVPSLSGITEGTYYIATLYNNKYYTVPNTTITGQTFTCLESSSSTNAISPASGSGEFVFTAVSGVNNAFYIYNTNLEKFLVATGSKKFGYVDNTSTDYGYWTFSTVSSGGFSGVFSVTHDEKTHYMRAYNNTVKCYDGASNYGVYLFLKSDVAATSVTIDDSGIIEKNLFNGSNAGTLTATVKVIESGNVLSEAAVTWSSSDMTVATINETTGAVTLVAAGTTTITASYAGVSNQYAASSATYELTVENYNPATPGTAGTPYTVTQARAAIDAGTGITNVYVTGIISQVDSYSSQYKSITYWISEDGTTTNQFEVYSGKGIGGADFSAKTDVKVGDEVVVYGSLQKYGETYEFTQNNQLVSTNHVNTPTFSLVAGNYNGEQNVTISCSTNDATIYYTLDGSDPTNSSTEYTGTLTLTNSVTLKAIAYKNGNSSNVASASYTIVVVTDNSPKSNFFTLVKSTDDLSDGDNIIIVGGSNKLYAMTTEQKTNNRGYVLVDENVDNTSVSITGITSGEYGVQKVVLKKAGDNWLFYVKGNSTGYLYAASSSNNNLKTKDTTDDNCKAIISIATSGIATITFQGSNTHNTMRFNSNLFSCYEPTSTTGTGVKIYKEVHRTANVTSAGYATFYSDYDVTIPSGVKAYYAEDGTDALVLHEVENKIKGGVGVVLEAAEGTYTFEATTGAENTSYTALKGVITETAQADLQGTYQYVLGMDGTTPTLFKLASDGSLDANKAYYAATSEHAAIGMRWEGTTGISSVEVTNDNVYYDLMGRKVEQPVRGIYILNGKKVFVK